MYKPQRLHPMAIFDFLVRNIYKLVQSLLPLLVLFIGDTGSRKWLLVALPVVLALFVGYFIAYWFRYVFYISGQELRLEYGVMVRKKRYIPFERIQTVQITAGILQRLFGLVKVQVETAGGGNQAEFVLAALSREKAEELRQTVQMNAQFIKNDNTAETDLIDYQLSTRSLFLLASTSNGIGIIFSAILVVFSQLNEVFSTLNIWDKLETIAENLFTGKASLIIITGLVLLLSAWLLSLLGTIIKFGGFRVVRDGDTLKITQGFLEKQQLTIPIKRIQAIRLVEGILRQPLGMVSVQVISISNTGEKGEGSVLFPLIASENLGPFLKEIVPEFAISFEVHKLPVQSKNRYLLVNVIPAFIIAVSCTVFLTWGYLAFLLLPIAAWLGNWQFNDTGWQLEDNKLLLRTRSLGRVSTIVPRRRIQSMHLSANFFQKRRNINSLTVAIASGSTVTGAKIKGIDSKNSKMIANWFSY